MKLILVCCFVALSALSCTITDHISPSPTNSCRLVQFVNVSGTNDFTYDASGSLSQWAITSVFDTLKQVVTYTFTRDATGRITTLRNTQVVNGEELVNATTRFTYTDGLLTGTRVFLDTTQSPFIIRAFTYDANRRMSKRVSTYDGGFVQTDTYEYDNGGNCIRRTYVDTDGFKTETTYTYDTSRNPEQLLLNSIPFNFFTGQPWSVNVAVTIRDTIDDGLDVFTATGERTNVKTDASGYVTATTRTFDGRVTNETYSLTGCN